MATSPSSFPLDCIERAPSFSDKGRKYVYRQLGNHIQWVKPWSFASGDAARIG